MKAPKVHKCKVCKEGYTKKATTQVVCSFPCSLVYAAKKREKKERQERQEWNREKKKRTDAMKTAKDYHKELQPIFNTFIRKRDELQPCISCTTILDSKKAKYDAGHYFSVGAYPELRYEERNVHGQCVECNQHLRSNTHEYRPKLIAKIGQEQLNELEAKRNYPRKYSIPELIELKVIYKDKIKALENEI